MNIYLNAYAYIATLLGYSVTVVTPDFIQTTEPPGAYRNPCVIAVTYTLVRAEHLLNLSTTKDHSEMPALSVIVDLLHRLSRKYHEQDTRPFMDLEFLLEPALNVSLAWGWNEIQEEQLPVDPEGGTPCDQQLTYEELKSELTEELTKALTRIREDSYLFELLLKIDGQPK